jgi:hypothetical protein
MRMILYSEATTDPFRNGSMYYPFPAPRMSIESNADTAIIEELTSLHRRGLYHQAYELTAVWTAVAEAGSSTGNVERGARKFIEELTNGDQYTRFHKFVKS